MPIEPFLTEVQPDRNLVRRVTNNREGCQRDQLEQLHILDLNFFKHHDSVFSCHVFVAEGGWKCVLLPGNKLSYKSRCRQPAP